ncbi:MAG: FAD-dependent oxidoreductase [Clostridia bacterium]|nr:FAD-dependent oxidoreductase [Clostridia bacterium]
MQKYDLAVVGGGFAGVSAALAAAREGAKVIIIEKANCLGGATTNCFVTPFMPYNTKINEKIINLSTGILDDIIKKLKEKNAYNNRRFIDEDLKLILNEMLTDAGVDILFHSYLFKVKKEKGNIKSISIATVNGVIDIKADYYIDATGDAQVAYLAKCPTLLGREKDNLCQPMTLCFRVGNVDVEKFMKDLPALQQAYAKSLANNEFINPRENILVFRTLLPNVLHFNTTRVIKKDPTSVKDLTDAEIIARKQVFEVYEFMKKHTTSFNDTYLITASEIGIRESRKIVGDYVLTESDCRSFTKFEDGISACNYDIDIHNPEGSGTSHFFFPLGEYYTIPYRCLIPKKLNNLLVAGRCISSDHGAQASYRIIPTVSSIGEAAGTAIGLIIKSGLSVRDVPITALKEKLIQNGMFIGQKTE